MDKIIEINRLKILEIAKRYGAFDIKLFGSRLKGTSNEDSDVDLLIKFEKGRDLLDLAGLKLDLEALLNKKVDIVSANSIHKTIAEKVMKEAKAI